MDLVHAAWASLAGAAFFHIFVLRDLVGKTKVVVTHADVIRLAMASLLSFIASMALLFSISIWAVIGSVELAYHFGTDSLENLYLVKSYISGLRTILRGIDDGSLIAVTLLVIAVAMIWNFANTRELGLNSLAAAKIDAEQDLSARAERGEVQELPPTPAMMALVERINGLRNKSVDFAGVMPRRQEIKNLINQLSDLNRQRYLHLQPVEAAALGFPVPRGWRDRLVSFFVSQGAVNTLKGGRRVVAVALGLLAGPVLIIPAAGAMQERLKFTELRVEADETQRTYERVKQSLPDVPSPPVLRLSDAELDQLAMLLFETRALPRLVAQQLGTQIGRMSVEEWGGPRHRRNLLAAYRLNGVETRILEEQNYIKADKVLDVMRRHARRLFDETHRTHAALAGVLQARTRSYISDYIASFGRPMTYEQVRVALLGQMLDHLVAATGVEDLGVLGRMVGKVAPDAMTNAIDLEYKKFVVSTVQHASLETATIAAQEEVRALLAAERYIPPVAVTHTPPTKPVMSSSVWDDIGKGLVKVLRVLR